MITGAVPVALIVATALLYRHLRRQPDRRRLWRTAMLLGIGGGIARGALASLAWLLLERTGGPLQIPAYLLALTALPEVLLLSERRASPVPLSFYVSLPVLLVAGTVAFVSCVALVADIGRREAGR